MTRLFAQTVRVKRLREYIKVNSMERAQAVQEAARVAADATKTKFNSPIRFADLIGLLNF